MDEPRLTTLMRELYDEGATHRAPPFPAAEIPRRRPGRRWLTVAGAAAVAAVVVAAVTLTNTNSDTARLVPVEGPTASIATPRPSSPMPSPTPSPTALPSPSDDPQSGVVNPPTGISSQGPQITGTRWMNVNAWQDRLTATTYLSVYAGGATIDPSLQSDATFAAVLVITPADLDKFDHNQVALNAIGTIYRAPGNPMGKLQVTSANGNLVSLTLVGTTQAYTFDDVTMTFR
jgi:hypothetical protein